MNICIITNGVLPVPAVQGGAVENLVQAILDKNEEYGLLDITVVSVFAGSVVQAAGKYRRNRFVFMKTPGVIRLFDQALFCVASNIMKRRDAFNFRYIFRRLHFICRCYRYLLKNDFDNIILENHHSLFLLLKSGKLRKRIRHKLYYHAHNQPFHDVFCGNEIRSCANYIAVSEYIQKTYQERYRGIASNFYVLKNAVNTGRFGQELSKETFTAERNKYSLDADDIIVLFTGRISEEKGIVELADAFVHINNPKLKLLIAGSGFFDTDIKTPLQGRLEQMLKSAVGRVVFTGYVQYAEIWKLYKIADIGCFPSVWNDPAPLIVIEAMAAGLPFITTNSGGIPEYARRDCAFILERDDALTAHIKQAIEILSQDAALRKKMGEKGKETGAEYNLDNYYRNFLAIVS